jgi:phospholipid/cholesterol/gamma-HCH transport system permease protein
MIDSAAPSIGAGPTEAAWTVTREDDASVLAMRGAWTLASSLPAPESIMASVRNDLPLRLDGSGLSAWDTGLMVFLRRLADTCRQTGIALDTSSMPEGARRLYRLATTVQATQQTAAIRRPGVIERIGGATMDVARGAREMTTFIGAATLSFGRLITGRARFKRADLWLTIQQCGADALPIVSLISFLVGVILAFVGFSQLRQFGAEIFVADLVGIAMARDIGPIMAAIVMAGRTGAAFSAQIGTMQVNEEIDALRTFGIPPMDFLVLPRMLALMLMLPLLALYSNLLGIAGGAVVGILEPTITLKQYWQQTLGAITLLDFAGGLMKSIVYGALVALAGCMRGMACGRSAAAVGDATTSAVVTGIVSVVVACATLTVLYDILGI